MRSTPSSPWWHALLTSPQRRLNLGAIRELFNHGAGRLDDPLANVAGLPPLGWLSHAGFPMWSGLVQDSFRGSSKSLEWELGNEALNEEAVFMHFLAAGANVGWNKKEALEKAAQAALFFSHVGAKSTADRALSVFESVTDQKIDDFPSAASPDDPAWGALASLVQQLTLSDALTSEMTSKGLMKARLDWMLDWMPALLKKNKVWRQNLWKEGFRRLETTPKESWSPQTWASLERFLATIGKASGDPVGAQKGWIEAAMKEKRLQEEWIVSAPAAPKTRM